MDPSSSVTSAPETRHVPRVLLTGASGFLGRACLAALLRAGAEVVATYRGVVPADAWARAPGLKWVQADLTNAAACAAVCADHRPTHLLALAWHMAPGYQQALENYRWITHSLDLICAFSASGGQRIVFCGSCMEYDWTWEAPFVEEVTPLRPATDYGAAKAALFTAYGPLCAQLGLSAAWARPYFLYGPGENPRRLAADVIVSLLQEREALCGPGTQRRDFMHVADVADAMTSLLFSQARGPMNIGSGTAVPLVALIEEIGRQIGRGDLIRLGAHEARPGEPDLVEADTTLLCKELNWVPSFTLETGLADTIAWWRAELEKDEDA